MVICGLAVSGRRSFVPCKRSACSCCLVIAVVRSSLSALGGAEANAANACYDASNDTEAEDDDENDVDGDGLVGSVCQVIEIAGLAHVPSAGEITGAVRSSVARFTVGGHIFFVLFSSL